MMVTSCNSTETGVPLFTSPGCDPSSCIEERETHQVDSHDPAVTLFSALGNKGEGVLNSAPCVSVENAKTGEEQGLFSSFPVQTSSSHPYAVDAASTTRAGLAVPVHTTPCHLTSVPLSTPPRCSGLAHCCMLVRPQASGTAMITQTEMISEEKIFTSLEPFLPSLQSSFPIVYQALYQYEWLRKQWCAEWKAKDEELGRCVGAGKEVLEQFNLLLAAIRQKELEGSAGLGKDQRTGPHRFNSPGRGEGVMTKKAEKRHQDAHEQGRRKGRRTLNGFLKVLLQRDSTSWGRRKSSEDDGDQDDIENGWESVFQEEELQEEEEYDGKDHPSISAASPELVATATLIPTVYRRLGSVWENTYALVQTCRIAAQQMLEEEEEERKKRKSDMKDPKDLVEDMEYVSPFKDSGCLTSAFPPSMSLLPPFPSSMNSPSCPSADGSAGMTQVGEVRKKEEKEEEANTPTFVCSVSHPPSSRDLTHWVYQVLTLLISSLSFLQESGPQVLKPFYTDLYVSYRRERQKVWKLRGQLQDMEREAKRWESKQQKAEEECDLARKGLEVVLKRVHQWYAEHQAKRSSRHGQGIVPPPPPLLCNDDAMHASLRDKEGKRLDSLLLPPPVRMPSVTATASAVSSSTIPTLEELLADKALYTLQQETLEVTVAAADQALKEQEARLTQVHQLALQHVQKRLDDRETELHMAQQIAKETACREEILTRRLQGLEKSLREEERVQEHLRQEVEKGKTQLEQERERWKKKQEEATRMIHVLQSKRPRHTTIEASEEGVPWAITGGAPNEDPASSPSGTSFPSSHSWEIKVMELYESSEAHNHRLQDDVFALRKKVSLLSDDLARSQSMLHEKEQENERTAEMLKELSGKEMALEQKLKEKDVLVESLETVGTQQKQIIQEQQEALQMHWAKTQQQKREEEHRARVDMHRIELLEHQLRRVEEEKSSQRVEHEALQKQYKEQKAKWAVVAKELEEKKRWAEEIAEALRLAREKKISQQEEFSLLQQQHTERNTAAQGALQQRIQELESLLQKMTEEKEAITTSSTLAQTQLEQHQKMAKDTLGMLEERCRGLAEQHQVAMLSLTEAEGEIGKWRRQVDELNLSFENEQQQRQKVEEEKRMLEEVITSLKDKGASHAAALLEASAPPQNTSLSVSSAALEPHSPANSTQVMEMEKELHDTLQSLRTEKKENVELRLMLQPLRSLSEERKTQLQVEQLKRSQAEEMVQYYKDQWKKALQSMEENKKHPREWQANGAVMGSMSIGTPTAIHTGEPKHIADLQPVGIPQNRSGGRPCWSHHSGNSSSSTTTTTVGEEDHGEVNGSTTTNELRIFMDTAQRNLYKGVKALLWALWKKQQGVFRELESWLDAIAHEGYATSTPPPVFLKGGRHSMGVGRPILYGKKERERCNVFTPTDPGLCTPVRLVLSQLRASILHEVKLAVCNAAAQQDLQWKRFLNAWATETSRAVAMTPQWKSSTQNGTSEVNVDGNAAASAALSSSLVPFSCFPRWVKEYLSEEVRKGKKKERGEEGNEKKPVCHDVCGEIGPLKMSDTQKGAAPMWQGRPDERKREDDEGIHEEGQAKMNMALGTREVGARLYEQQETLGRELEEWMLRLLPPTADGVPSLREAHRPWRDLDGQGGGKCRKDNRVEGIRNERGRSSRQEVEAKMEENERRIHELEVALQHTQGALDQSVKARQQQETAAAAREKEWNIAWKRLHRSIAEEGLKPTVAKEPLKSTGGPADVECCLKKFGDHFISPHAESISIPSVAHILALKQDTDQLLREEMDAMRSANEELERRLQQAEDDRSRMRLQLYELLGTAPSRRCG